MKIRLFEHFTYSKLIKFTLPSIAMMVFMSVYGVVDGFFVSNYVGKTPFAAINLIWPFLMILSTVGFMFGAGGTAIVAKTFGEGDSKRANSYFSLFVYVSFFLGLIFALVGFSYIRPISIFLGAEGELLENCVIYGRVILIALPFNVLQFLFQSFFVAAEKPNLGFLVTLASGITNMLLDAILVLSLPFEYKLIGAAIATAMSQIVAGVFSLVYFFRKNDSILRLGKTRFDARALFKATVNGSSEFMSNVSMNVVGILYNFQLMKYAGEDGVAAYGVMMYVSFIFASAFIGYSIGTAPVIGYHFGAHNSKELKSILRKSIVIVGILSVAMVLVGEALSLPLSRIFVGYDEELLSLTVYGFRVFALSFLFMGYAIYGSGFFTALNDGVVSAVISFLRTLVFQAAAVMFLPLIWEINGVWISVVVAEFMAVVISLFFLKIKQKKYGYY